MQHVRLAAVHCRQVTQDEATTLRLPALKSAPELEEWRLILFQAADNLDHFGWCRGSPARSRQHRLRRPHEVCDALAGPNTVLLCARVGRAA
jgi:hypothetical protein